MSEETMTERRHAYVVKEINQEDGTVTVIINKGILGAISNQLKTCPDSRKGYTIIRKMGFDLAQVGDLLFGNDIDNQELTSVIK